MAVGSRRAAQSRERAGAGEAEARAALGAGGEGVHLRHGRGTKTLAELFDGRSQVLARNIMFGPDYTVGACPGCSNLADHLDAAVVHLNHRDVTLLGFSRASVGASGLQGADGVAVSLRLDVRERLPLRLRPRPDLIEQPRDWLQDWSKLDRLRAGGRRRLPHLYKNGARSGLRGALLPPAARPDAEGTPRRVPGLPP